MKIQSVLTAALLAGIGHAEETQKAVSPELPVFVPTKIQAEFLEQFTRGWDSRWKPSHAKKDTKNTNDQEEWAYVGEWAVEEPHVYKGMEGNPGLVVKNAAAHHAISAKFPKKIDNTDKTFVVQYEVKLQNGLQCGGAYLKLLRENDALHQEEFSNVTPYVIMFGPDKCGHTNKIHFIFNHKNPKTGEYEEKHLNPAPSANIVPTTELYTLIVHPNNTFVIKQNGEPVKEGSLLEDFTPAVNPPAEIDDPNDTKPENWVDQARIPDPDAAKPEDWDEDAPFEIVDDDAEKPEDWLDDEPATIPDPKAEKPEYWDDEEDGDWIAPKVPNPKCGEVSGCGPWQKPMKKNPAYRGKWSAPLIDNPAYKGPWAPRKIPNPDYYEDKTPANFEPMGAIGFEIWTMQNDIMFNNIYIGHSIEDANKLAEETFYKKNPVEKQLQEAEKPKKDDKPLSPSDLKFLDDPKLFITEKLELFWAIFQNDPVEAVKFVPEVPIGIVSAVVLVFSLLFIAIGGSSAPAPAPKKPADKKKADGDAKEAKSSSSASATGASAGKGEATKRVTRSQS